MKKIFLLICFVFLSSTFVQAKTINVLTTTEDLKSIAEFVGGDKVKVSSLGKGNQNYHFLAAKPSFMLKARRSDLFIVNGMDLEIGYESLILEGSRNSDIQVGRIGYLNASEGIKPLDVLHHVDRSMGDVHPHGNPHYSLDPMNAKIIASSVKEKLVQLSPENKFYFQENLSRFHQRIDEKMKEWSKELAPYQGQKVITYHKTWLYFAERFGLEVIEELEPKPGVAPSPGHLKSIVDVVRNNDVKLILNENIYSTKAAEFVARETGIQVVVLPISVGGDRESKDYFSLIDTVVEKIKQGFVNAKAY